MAPNRIPKDKVETIYRALNTRYDVWMTQPKAGRDKALTYPALRYREPENNARRKVKRKAAGKTPEIQAQRKKENKSEKAKQTPKRHYLMGKESANERRRERMKMSRLAYAQPQP
jgi:hypothetical protein